MPLHEIKVYFESDDNAHVEVLMDEFERSISPHAPTSDHRCPNRWFIMRSILDADDAAKVEDLVNE